jgi:hypothetical protein
MKATHTEVLKKNILTSGALLIDSRVNECQFLAARVYYATEHLAPFKSVSENSFGHSTHVQLPPLSCTVVNWEKPSYEFRLLTRVWVEALAIPYTHWVFPVYLRACVWLSPGLNMHENRNGFWSCSLPPAQLVMLCITMGVWLNTLTPWIESYFLADDAWILTVMVSNLTNITVYKTNKIIDTRRLLTQHREGGRAHAKYSNEPYYCYCSIGMVQ